ncbi:MAG: DnaJ family domain-containing protein [Desulfovermiculus sp.]
MSNALFSFQLIAEQRINEAIEKGELDNLPGQGKPINLDDDTHLPPEMRMAYRILKNAGYVSPEVEQRREIASIREMISQCEDEELCYRQVQKLNLLVTKLNMQRKVPVNLEAEQVYYRKVVGRVPVKDRKK